MIIEHPQKKKTKQTNKQGERQKQSKKQSLLSNIINLLVITGKPFLRSVVAFLHCRISFFKLVILMPQQARVNFLTLSNLATNVLKT